MKNVITMLLIALIPLTAMAGDRDGNRWYELQINENIANTPGLGMIGEIAKMQHNMLVADDNLAIDIALWKAAQIVVSSRHAAGFFFGETMWCNAPMQAIAADGDFKHDYCLIVNKGTGQFDPNPATSFGGVLWDGTKWV